jgi:hypothetical protein
MYALCFNSYGMNEGPAAFAKQCKLSTNAVLCIILLFSED